MHDALTLAELQWQLLALDSRQYFRRLLWPALALAIGAALAFSCLPLALVVLALVLVETTTLSLAQSFGVSLGVGVAMSLFLISAGRWFLRNRMVFLERSRSQWQTNIRWAKETLRRLKKPRS